MVKVPRLRAARERGVLTQAELAERAGVTRVTIQRAERGEEARPATVRKIAAALKRKPADLLAPATEGGR